MENTLIKGSLYFRRVHITKTGKIEEITMDKIDYFKRQKNDHRSVRFN